jgi:pimeloyl-ACP methyl ester carboxylesterase
VALYFGDVQAPLFGWWHAPGPVQRPGAAVLLCAPFGMEELNAHRAWRALARQLAQAGAHVLRYDYPNCGDSAGDVSDLDLLPAWQRSVHQGIDELKRRSGQLNVVLVGLRLGALLAMRAALERDDVAGYAAIAPVLSGRAYVREMRALQATAAKNDDSDPVFDGLESGGFAINAATLDSLLTIDLRQPARAPAGRCLLVDRAKMPSLERFAAALSASGASVDLQVLPGYEELMLEPHTSREPLAMWAAVVRWLDGLKAVAAACAATGPNADAPATAEFDGVCETALSFSVLRGTVQAVLTQPPSPLPASKIVLMLNAGAARRVGLGRSYVSLARQLARNGQRALRVDLCGLGDSDAQPGAEDTVVYSATAVAEVRALVLALHQSFGAGEVAIVGWCSGAYHALMAAAQGAEVSAVVAINPLTYVWHEGMQLDSALQPFEVIEKSSHLFGAVFSSARWRQLLRREVELATLAAVLWAWVRAHGERNARFVARVVHWPMKVDLARDLRTAAQRNVHFHFLFAEGDPGEALLHEQAGNAVRRLVQEGAVQIRRIAGADHIFSRRARRMELLAFVLAGLADNGFL